jgi:septum site-determining protein MinC
MNSSPSSRSLLTSNKSIPLVIDLAAFLPDGSPHFKTVEATELVDLLNTLRANAIYPVAVTSSSGTLNGGIERVAQSVGLPYVMPNGRGAGQQLSLEDVFRLVDVSGGGEFEEGSSEGGSSEGGSSPSSSQEVKVVIKEVIKEVIKYVEVPSPQEPPHPESVSSFLSAPAAPPTGKTLIHTSSVRSGQTVTSPENGSVIILGNVSSGGEVVSDNSIHVYGKLLGRALAGLNNGEGECVVSAKHFDPELLVVNGEMWSGDENFEGVQRGESVVAVGKGGGVVDFVKA